MPNVYWVLSVLQPVSEGGGRHAAPAESERVIYPVCPLIAEVVFHQM